MAGFRLYRISSWEVSFAFVTVSDTGATFKSAGLAVGADVQTVLFVGTGDIRYGAMASGGGSWMLKPPLASMLPVASTVSVLLRVSGRIGGFFAGFGAFYLLFLLFRPLLDKCWTCQDRHIGEALHEDE